MERNTHPLDLAEKLYAMRNRIDAQDDFVVVMQAREALIMQEDELKELRRLASDSARYQADYNAALATIEYLKETVEEQKQQLIKRDAWMAVKVEGNFWVYGSEKACLALQKILFEHLALTGRDVQNNGPD